MAISRLPMMVLSLFYLQSVSFDPSLRWLTGILMILLSVGILQRNLYPRQRKELLSFSGLASLALLIGGFVFGIAFLFNGFNLFSIFIEPSWAVYVGYLGLSAATLGYLGV